MISALILTFNEELNIKRCLESISWVDNVVVVDSFSTDCTVELARSAGARVLQNRFVNFAEQRNFGLRAGGFKNEWVLHLDADEIVSPELKDELTRAIQTQAYTAYRVSSKLFFQGRWIRYSSMYPCYQVRLGRTEVLDFMQVGHGQRENLPEHFIGTLKEPLLHYSFSKGLEDWLARHNRYSSAEAAENVESSNLLRRIPWKALLSKRGTTRRRALKELSKRLPCRPTFRLLYVYVIRLGFLDGVAGWHYCQLLSIYERMIVLKIRELESNKEHQ